MLEAINCYEKIKGVVGKGLGYCGSRGQREF